MKLGVNNDVSLDTKRVGVKLMNGSPSKTNRPTSRPSNPIHRQDSEKKPSDPVSGAELQPSDGDESKVKSGDGDSKHEILKSGIIIAAVVTAFVIYRISR